jgi:hypothetical protein
VVTPGWIGWIDAFALKFAMLAREAPEALRFMALVIDWVAWLASAPRIMFWTSVADSGPRPTWTEPGFKEGFDVGPAPGG